MPEAYQQQQQRPQGWSQLEYTHFRMGYTNLHAVRQAYRDLHGEDCFAEGTGIGHNSRAAAKQFAA